MPSESVSEKLTDKACSVSEREADEKRFHVLLRQRRYFVLEDGVLTYSATPEDSTPLGRIPLGTATVKRKELPLGKWMLSLSLQDAAPASGVKRLSLSMKKAFHTASPHFDCQTFIPNAPDTSLSLANSSLIPNALNSSRSHRFTHKHTATLSRTWCGSGPVWESEI